jgi:hypothetical protein
LQRTILDTTSCIDIRIGERESEAAPSAGSEKQRDLIAPAA